MNIETEISADGQATITFDVSKDELGNRLPEALEYFRSHAKIPGFRPGKVPMSIIKKRYGDDVVTEKAEEIAREYMIESLKTEELKPGGRITLNLLKYGLDSDLKFAVIFPIQPTVELFKYKGLSISINSAEVIDADVDSEIEAFRKDHAVLISVDTPATAEAKLALKVVEVDPSGLPLINVETKEVEFTFGTDMLGVGTDEQILGVRAGETRRIVVRKVGGLIQTPQQTKIISPSGASNPANFTAGETLYSVEVSQVEIHELPAVDDEFAKKIDPNFSSMDDMRQIIKIRISGLIAFSYQKLLRSGLIAKLVEENPFTIHHSIIDNFLEESMGKGKDNKGDLQEYIDKNRPEFEQEYRWILLRSKIIEAENLIPVEEEIETEYEQISRQSELPVEKVREHYQDKEHQQGLIDTILERKVLRLLADSAIIDKRSMSVYEFLQAARS